MRKLSIDYDIPEKDLEIAKGLMSGKAFNKNSIHNDDSNQLTGFLAEIAFKRLFWHLEFEYVGHRSFEHDYLLGAIKFDIKAKQRNVLCQPDYDIHIRTSQRNYDCDYYIFASVYKTEKVEFMSYMRKDMFWRNCRVYSEGEGQDFTEKAEAGKLRYCDTLPITDLIDKVETYVYQKAFGEK